MNKDNSFSFSMRVVIGIATIGIALYFLKAATGLIVPLLLAGIIVLSASPLMGWLQHKKLPNWLAFILTFLTITAVFGSLAVTLIVSVDQLGELIPMYAEEMQGLNRAIEDLMSALGVNQESASELGGLIEPGKVFEIAGSLLIALVESFSNVIFIFMMIIFMLIDAFSLPAKVSAEIKAGNNYVKRLSDFSVGIRRYVSITTVIGLLTGVLDTIFFIIMGLPMPFLWGVLAFLLSYIPGFGFWLAAIPPTILAYLEGGIGPALVVLVGIILINGFADEVLKPKFMGQELNLSIFTIIFSVFFWTAVLGPMGSILGVPLTMTVKELILEADERTGWIAHFMSKKIKEGPRENEQ
jgi:predicted PurR-regulated permease PerM